MPFVWGNYQQRPFTLKITGSLEFILCGHVNHATLCLGDWAFSAAETWPSVPVDVVGV